MSITLLSWVDTNGVDHIVKCDAVVGLLDEQTSEVTEHPVENGSVTTDHIIHNPPNLTLEIRISNTPILPDDQFALKKLDLPEPKNSFKAQGLFLLHSAAGALIGAVLGGAKGKKSPIILQAVVDTDRIVELHDKLLLAQRKGASVSIDRYGRSYVDYVITSTKYERNGNGEGGKGKFQLTLKRIRTVALASTELPDPEKFHAKVQTSRGSKPGKTTEAEQKDLLTPGSLAYEGLFGKKGLDAFSGVIR